MIGSATTGLYGVLWGGLALAAVLLDVPSLAVLYSVLAVVVALAGLAGTTGSRKS